VKTILCYGDSNTWGAVPGILTRHPFSVRWPGVLSKELGSGCQIVEDGINGRRTVWEDPENPCRNGLEGLGYALYRAKPLDLVILMLGTNDLNHTDAAGYYEGISAVAERILDANRYYHGSSPVFSGEPKLLLVSPIELDPSMPMYKESQKFALYTKRLAEELQVPWLNAAKFAKPSPIDGCHMNEENHLLLGKAIARKLQTLL